MPAQIGFSDLPKIATYNGTEWGDSGALKARR